MRDAPNMFSKEEFVFDMVLDKSYAAMKDVHHLLRMEEFAFVMVLR